jgi:serine/threonine-protein kinase RsbW
MKFPAEIDALPEMLYFVCKGAKECGLPPTFLNKLELASEEAVVNVINYGYPKDKGMIELNYENDDQFFILHIIDEGIAFNPIEKETKVDFNVPLEQKKVGGLGIYLIRQLMDEVHYAREGNKNHLTLKIKYFP